MTSKTKDKNKGIMYNYPILRTSGDVVGVNRKNAFTLIELSISLIIIGLVAGGILIGRDLIRAAELRGDIRQIEKINLSVQAFRSKYGCLPGDCPVISQVLTGATNGDGNGRIGIDPPGCYESWTASTEYVYAVDHLARAAMIENTPFDVNSAAESGAVGKGLIPMKSKTNRGMLFGCGYTDASYCSGGALTIDYQCSFIGLGMANLSGTYIGPAGTYKPVDAYQIDGKIDDGFPYSGGIVAMIDYASDGVLFPMEPAGADVCGVTGGGGFNTCVQDPNGNYICSGGTEPLPYNTAGNSPFSKREVCALRVKASF